MPYSSVSEVPSYVPKGKRKMWMEVWNSIYNEHGDESRAFAGANAAVKKTVLSELVKFGTENTGFTKGEWGPFNCSRCEYSKAITDYHICENDAVSQDEAVPEDEFGNKVIEGNDCCNHWTPKEE